MLSTITTPIRVALGTLALAGLLISLTTGVLRADTLSDIYQQLVQRPRDVSLNLQYAKEAEKVGKLKWALPAYERVLTVEPDNKEAEEGLDRIGNTLRDEADSH